MAQRRLALRRVEHFQALIELGPQGVQTGFDSLFATALGRTHFLMALRRDNPSLGAAMRQHAHGFFTVRLIAPNHRGPTFLDRGGGGLADISRR